LIAIDTERCNGCGACLEVCPAGALYLVDGKAAVDDTLCRECEACLAACAMGAITLATREEAVEQSVRLPALRPEAEIIRVKTQPEPLFLRARVLPAVGAVVAWAGRELLPLLADPLLDALDRWATGPQPTEVARGRETRGAGGKGGGRRYRHRQRGGRE
jgi:NAD-dependent dihydropyrimidine dehydrogenase PreA subunit